MREYELIREMFDNCSGKARSTVEEIETDDPEAFLRKEHYIMPGSTWDSTVLDDGSIVYEVITSGIKNKYTFTEI